MSKFNAFRPTVSEMENRTLMSVSPFAIAVDDPAARTGWDLVANKKLLHISESTAIRYELENVLVTSYQSGGHEGLTKVGTGHLILPNANETAAAGSSGMSAGKVSYSDLSVMMSSEGGTFLDLLGRPSDPVAAGHKGEIEILSWNFGASNPSAAGKANFKEFTFKKLTDAASPATLAGIGTLEFNGVQVDADAAGSHALYQDIMIPTGAASTREASVPSVSEIVVTKVHD